MLETLGLNHKLTTIYLSILLYTKMEHNLNVKSIIKYYQLNALIYDSNLKFPMLEIYSINIDDFE
jgi:hypothetical protein